MGMFRLLADELAAALETTAVLDADEEHSGPRLGTIDPFTAGELDVAFMCAPSYLRLASLDPSPVMLVPAAPVFDDDRNEGRPVYFTDIVVARGHDALTVEDLVGTRWAYNDASSLSGYECIAHELPAGTRPELWESGSHEASVRAVRDGEVDAAAVDANVLARLTRESPGLTDELRVVSTWGPYPVQPIVAARSLGEAAVQALADRLLSLGDGLHDFGVRQFAPMDHSEIAHALAWLRD
jgi:phosphonate transport system substrate-binding protein